MKLKLNPKPTLSTAITYAKFLDDIIYRHPHLTESTLEKATAVIKAVFDEALDNLLEMCTPEKSMYRVNVEMDGETFEVEATSKEEAEAKAQKMFLDGHHHAEVTATKIS